MAFFDLLITARRSFSFTLIAILSASSFMGCSSPSLQPGSPPTPSTKTDPQSQPSSKSPSNSLSTVGTLQFVANGEDFVRKGLLTKDGWQLSFDHVYTTLAEVTASQNLPPLKAVKGKSPQSQTLVRLESPITVDLAAGDETAKPVFIGTKTAPVGHYKALSWKMVSSTHDPSQGYALMLVGQATKGEQRLNFSLKSDRAIAFVCGDYVGDERKGILRADQTADLEATYHFDHLFGDGNAPATDEVNTGALGFAPFALLAQDNLIEADLRTLQDRLPASAYEKFLKILETIGHVGEGHCEASSLDP